MEHLAKVAASDGTYVIDVTVDFELAGMHFLVLFECKRHTEPVKRQDVQVLYAKLQSTGAHKGVLVSTSGFQRGAVEFAKSHGIACIRFVDKAFTYEVRYMTSPFLPQPEPSGEVVAYQVEATDEGLSHTQLSEQPDHVRRAILSDLNSSD